MIDKMSLVFEVGDKSKIEDLITSSDKIPEDEIHVQRATSYALRLGGIDSRVLLALTAMSNPRLGCSHYVVGYVGSAHIIIGDVHQKSPLIVNNPMVERALKQFTGNRAYSHYEIEVLSPTIEIIRFCRSRGALAPYATPDRVCADR